MKPERLTIPRGGPGADLLALLEPYLWVNEVTPVYAGHYRGALLYFEVSGIVRGPELESPPEPPDQVTALVLANGARSWLFGRAETAIAAVEEPGGYEHARHPEFEITGQRRDPKLADQIAGKPYLLIAEARLKLWLKTPVP